MSVADGPLHLVLYTYKYISWRVCNVTTFARQLSSGQNNTLRRCKLYTKPLRSFTSIPYTSLLTISTRNEQTAPPSYMYMWGNSKKLCHLKGLFIILHCESNLNYCSINVSEDFVKFIFTKCYATRPLVFSHPSFEGKYPATQYILMPVCQGNSRESEAQHVWTRGLFVHTWETLSKAISLKKLWNTLGTQTSNTYIST